MTRRFTWILWILLLLLPFTALADVLVVTFLDVGQGDAILAQCGGQTLLVDTGPAADADAFVERLLALGVTKLDYVVATHPLEDHVGGLAAVVDAFNIGAIWMPNAPQDAQVTADARRALDRHGYEIALPRVGSTHVLGEALVTVLGPMAEAYDTAEQYSIVLRLDHGMDAFLMMGDADVHNEMELLASGNDLHADVLKVGRHGSDGASSAAFLEAVRPHYAVISCGASNGEGIPNQAVLDRLRDVGATVLRTDRQGNIVFVTSGEGVVPDGRVLEPDAQRRQFAKVSVRSVNMRAQPTTDGRQIMFLRRETPVEILGQEVNVRGELWCAVRAGNQEGYVRGDLLAQIGEDEYAALLAAAEAEGPSGTPGLDP